jgi:serine/threonine protein kinase
VRLRRRRERDAPARPAPPGGAGGAPGTPGDPAPPGAAVPVEPDNREGAKPSRSSWELAEGDELVPGRTVIRRLGGGSRYEALLVWDDRLFALTVAKVLRPALVDDRSALDDLRDEALALERLRHPVLLRGFDAVLDGPRPHLLVEHLEGPTLRSLIRHAGPLPLEQVLPLALHVAAALHLLREEGWVHLDVKPDNIVMFVPPRLIDLSVARTIASAARIRGPVGTDAYMAPEQCDPAAHPGAIGPAADMFGLGATLFHAWSGRVPFPRPRGARESDDPAERFPQLHADPEPLPGHTPAPLAAALAAALDRDPAKRPAPAELVAQLEPLVSGLPRKLVLSRGAGLQPR